MKQTIRLNENDLRRMIKEALDELSPELLYHASEKAYDKGRDIQSNKLRNGAKLAFNRDYGWRNKETREPSTTSSNSYDNYLDFYVNGERFEGGNDEEDEIYANKLLKPAQRNRFFGGQAARKRMFSGQDPNGNPYESDLSEAINRTLRKILG